MTKQERLDLQRNLERLYGPEKVKLVHQFSNGYSIVRIIDYGSLLMEGDLMHHSWGLSYWYQIMAAARAPQRVRPYDFHLEHSEGGVQVKSPIDCNLREELEPKFYSLRDADGLSISSFYAWENKNGYHSKPNALYGDHNSKNKAVHKLMIYSWWAKQVPAKVLGA